MLTRHLSSPQPRSRRGRWLPRVAVVVSISIFILTSAIAIRTLWIRTNDLFHFGQKDHWWCYAIINFGHLRGSVDTYAPGVPPRHSGPAQSAGRNWFFYHVAANGGIWALSGGPTGLTVIDHDYRVFGFREYSVAGVPNGITYWVDLPYVPLMFWGVTAAIVGCWGYRYWKQRALSHQGFCPTCRYDLRAHTPGERCPECGTPTPTTSS